LTPSPDERLAAGRPGGMQHRLLARERPCDRAASYAIAPPMCAVTRVARRDRLRLPSVGEAAQMRHLSMRSPIAEPSCGGYAEATASLPLGTHAGGRSNPRPGLACATQPLPSSLLARSTHSSARPREQPHAPPHRRALATANATPANVLTPASPRADAGDQRLARDPQRGPLDTARKARNASRPGLTRRPRAPINAAPTTQRATGGAPTGP
jgi:hypothetical protein